MHIRIRILSILLSIAAFQACTRSAADYVRAGGEHLKAGRLEDAALNYRKALQASQENGEAFYGLGNVLRLQGKYREALAAFTRASELRPRMPEAHVAAADAAIALFVASGNRAEAVFEIATKSVQRLEQAAPDNYQTIRLNGQLALLNRRYNEAIELLSRAKAMEPRNRAATLPLVEALLGVHRNAEAEKVALETLEHHRTFSEMYDILFQIYMRTAREGQAQQVLERKLAADPENLSAGVQLAAFHAAAPGGTEKAEAVLARFVQNPKYPQADLQAGNMYMRVGQAALARKHFEAGLAQKNAFLNAYRSAVSALYWADGRQDEAIALVQAGAGENPKDLEARRLRGSYLLSRGRAADADIIISDYAAVLEADPNNHIVNYQLGRAWRLKRDNKSAVKYLQAAARAGSYLAPKLLLAEIHAESRNYVEALRNFDEILQIDKENNEVRVLRAVALRSLGREKDARAELQRVLRSQPGLRSAELEMAVLELTSGQPARAQALFARWHKPGSSQPHIAVGLAESLLAQKQYASAVDVLEKEAGTRNNDSSLRFAAAEAAERGGDIRRAISELESLSANPLVLVRLGQLRMRSGEQQKGLEDLRKAATLAPNDSKMQEALATGLHLTGRAPEAVPVYVLSLKLDPANAGAANNLAWLYADENSNLDEALKLARLAVQKAPDNPNYADTLAHVYARKNMHDSAVQVMRGVVTKNPEIASYRIHLATVLLDGGNKDEARTELAAASKGRLSTTQQAEVNRLLTLAR
jgi:tetratricopeptide (TPR) repeat protein